MIKALEYEHTHYRIVIVTVELLMHIKPLNEAVKVSHRKLVQKHNMGLPYSKVLLEHLYIASGLASIVFDDVFIGKVLPDLCVIGLLTDD